MVSVLLKLSFESFHFFFELLVDPSSCFALQVVRRHADGTQTRARYAALCVGWRLGPA